MGAAPADDPGRADRKQGRSGGVLQPLPVHGGGPLIYSARSTEPRSSCFKVGFLLISSLDALAVLPCQGGGSFLGRHEEWRLQGETIVVPPAASSVWFPNVYSDSLLLLQVLDEELRLNKCSSFELIEQYYLEKISHQVCNQADNLI